MRPPHVGTQHLMTPPISAASADTVKRYPLYNHCTEHWNRYNIYSIQLMRFLCTHLRTYSHIACGPARAICGWFPGITLACSATCTALIVGGQRCKVATSCTSCSFHAVVMPPYGVQRRTTPPPAEFRPPAEQPSASKGSPACRTTLSQRSSARLPGSCAPVGSRCYSGATVQPEASSAFVAAALLASFTKM